MVQMQESSKHEASSGIIDKENFSLPGCVTINTQEYCQLRRLTRNVVLDFTEAQSP